MLELQQTRSLVSRFLLTKIAGAEWRNEQMSSPAGGQRAEHYLLQLTCREHCATIRCSNLTLIICLGLLIAENESEVTAEINLEEKASAFSVAGEATNRGIALRVDQKVDRGVEGLTLDPTLPRAGVHRDPVEEATIRSLQEETEGETIVVRVAGLEEETAPMKRRETDLMRRREIDRMKRKGTETDQ